jgi:hypothetical protein
MLENEFNIRHVTLQPELPADPSFPLARLTRHETSGHAHDGPDTPASPSDPQGLRHEH